MKTGTNKLKKIIFITILIFLMCFSIGGIMIFLSNQKLFASTAIIVAAILISIILNIVPAAVWLWLRKLKPQQRQSTIYDIFTITGFVLIYLFPALVAWGSDFIDKYNNNKPLSPDSLSSLYIVGVIYIISIITWFSLKTIYTIHKKGFASTEQTNQNS